MNVFEDVGFQWDRCSVPKHVPTHTVARATFRMHKMLAEFVFDARAQEFNERLLDFYVTKDATDMLAFLVSCHPDFETDVGN